MKNIYEDLLIGERLISSEYKAEILLGMKSLGSGFEKMVNSFVKKNEISDLEVNFVKKKYNITESGRMFGMIRTLEEFNLFEGNSCQNYNRIRVLRNKSTHDDNHYANSSIVEIKKEAFEMYNLLIIESNLLIDKYLTKTIKINTQNSNQLRNYESTFSKKNKNKTNSNSSAVVLIVIFVILIYVFFSYVLSQDDIDQKNAGNNQRSNSVVQEMKNRMDETDTTIAEEEYTPEVEAENITGNKATESTDLPDAVEEVESESPYVDTANTDEVYLNAINRFRSAWYNNYPMGIGDTSSPRCMDVWQASQIQGVYSSDISVVTIDLNGVVTGVGKGSAYVVIWMGGQVADASIYHIE